MPRPPQDLLDDPELLARMSPSLVALARRGIQRHYRAGTLIIHEGDVGDTLFIILAGRLRSYSEDEASGKQITFGEYGPGEYLGEMSLDGGPRSANNITLTPATCAVITRTTLLRHLQEDPAFALELLAKVIRLARLATRSASLLALNDVYGRLKAFVEAHAVRLGDGRLVVPGRHTHQDLAGHLGCTRVMVTRLLQDLKKGGYLAIGAEGIEILRDWPAKW